jgi:hypothetical protein
VGRARRTLFGLRDVDPRQPIGMYTGNPPLPTTPRVTLTEQLLASFRGGSAGLRLSASTARNERYVGTDVIRTPTYPSGPRRVNRPDQLALASRTVLPDRGPGVEL